MNGEKKLICSVCSWDGTEEDLQIKYRDENGFELTTKEVFGYEGDTQEFLCCPECGTDQSRIIETNEYLTYKNERNIDWCRRRINELEKDVRALSDIIAATPREGVKKNTVKKKRVKKPSGKK